MCCKNIALIKSPKQRLETYCFCSVSYYYFYWKRRIGPLMVTYHYVKFYVSIIIQLEVININVRNFNFPIGFYCNSHTIWTPQQFDK
jgi:hypothetical protein